MAFSAAREARHRVILLRARRTRGSHDIIIPRSEAKGYKVNSRRADEVFGEHAPHWDLIGIPCPFLNHIIIMLLLLRSGSERPMLRQIKMTAGSFVGGALCLLLRISPRQCDHWMRRYLLPHIRFGVSGRERVNHERPAGPRTLSPRMGHRGN